MAATMKERLSRLTDRVGNVALIKKASALYESLSPRDRRLLWLLVGFFSLAGLGGTGWAGKTYLSRLDRDIQRKQDQLSRVEAVRTEHQTLKAQIDKLEQELKQNPDFNLTAYLERTSTEVGFTDPANIQSKGEVAGDGFKEISVDVRVRKAPLDKIVTYLYQIERSPQRLNVKRLRVYPAFGSKTDLNAELEVSVLAPQEGKGT
jgi:general secretion pathway protein M